MKSKYEVPQHWTHNKFQFLNPSTFILLTFLNLVKLTKIYQVFKNAVSLWEEFILFLMWSIKIYLIYSTIYGILDIQSSHVGLWPRKWINYKFITNYVNFLDVGQVHLNVIVQWYRPLGHHHSKWWCFGQYKFIMALVYHLRFSQIIEWWLV